MSVGKISKSEIRKNPVPKKIKKYCMLIKKIVKLGHVKIKYKKKFKLYIYVYIHVFRYLKKSLVLC